ncbi:MAG: iron-sulfur cluster assembly scaffold protein [Candidatus Woesearchaeota archaeon]
MTYSDTVMEHFRNPKHHGEIQNPDGIGKVGNPQCGDLLWVYIKVGRNLKGEKILEDAKVKTFGCVAAISSSDVLCEIAIGKTIEEAKKITKKEILEKLGQIPAQKIHCSVLAADALQKAIEDYEKKIIS